MENIRLELNRSGYYEIRYNERAEERTVVKTVSTGCKGRDEATAWLQGWRVSKDLVNNAAASQFIGAILTSYESVLESKGAGETQKICVQHLRKFFSKTRINQIDSQIIIDYCKARNVSDPTLRRELGALKAAIMQAHKDRKITLADIPHIDLPRPSEPKKTYLPEADEVDFYNRAQEHGGRLALFVAIALDTAARKEAILDLTWDRVDLNAGTIDFRIPGQQLHNKRRTVVPINSRLLPILKAAHANKTTDYILTHAGSIRKSWETFIKQTPYEITPHDLRRSFASIAVSNGVSFEDVAEVLCDSVETVRRHYGHLDPRAKLRAVNHRKF
jgi:hypothetical protein